MSTLKTILGMAALPVVSFAATYATCTSRQTGSRPTTEHGHMTPKCSDNRATGLDGWSCSDWLPVSPITGRPMHAYGRES